MLICVGKIVPPRTSPCSIHNLAHISSFLFIEPRPWVYIIVSQLLMQLSNLIKISNRFYQMLHELYSEAMPRHEQMTGWFAFHFKTLKKNDQRRYSMGKTAPYIYMFKNYSKMLTTFTNLFTICSCLADALYIIIDFFLKAFS